MPHRAKLRLASAIDAPAIHVQVQATYAHLWGRLPESTVFSETVDHVTASFSRGPVWVVEVDDRVAASVRADIVQQAGHPLQRWVEVHRLAVLPSHAGRGLGRLLMQAVEAYARDALGVPAVVELEVRAAQPESEGFYRALGYENRGVSLRLKTGEPRSFRMRKTLA